MNQIYVKSKSKSQSTWQIGKTASVSLYCYKFQVVVSSELRIVTVLKRNYYFDIFLMKTTPTNFLQT